MSLLTDHDIYLFREGNHTRLYDKLGCHVNEEGEAQFAVWAPNARAVSVIADFNGWNPGAHVLNPRWDGSGIWEATVPGVHPGAAYKYRVVSHHQQTLEKGDPFAFCWEEPPRTASRVWLLDYEWQDSAWMRERARRNALDAPMSTYELHIGSWRRDADGKFLGYRGIAEPLVEHIKKLGFTHVELMPITEHPFYGSWGYQTTGYFAPTARYGTPQDFMYLVDTLHQNGIGVILDWVPSHFPNDEHGLYRFDGTHLYEHADPRQGYHPDWNSAIFNYGRNEVRSFLISSALCWLDRFHVDGLRVDAVASMLYLDYSREAGEWIPNRVGGRENLEAIDFLRQLNDTIHEEFPDVATFAEESTAWPMVTGGTDHGGLGFGFKWDMGWMHDTLQYLRRDPVHRRFHHDEVTFRSVYAFTERYVMPLSHDEVVHGKGSLIGKMPGDDWQRFANLRLLFGMMWAQPGKKLLFMGGELGSWAEWNHDAMVDWDLHDAPLHSGVRLWVAALNQLYRDEPALAAGDADPAGFRWIIGDDDTHSVFAWLRLDPTGAAPPVLAVINATPTVHYGYRIGVPTGGRWTELLNSDAEIYGGSGMGNLGGVDTEDHPWHGFERSLPLIIPPLAVILLRPAD